MTLPSALCALMISHPWKQTMTGKVLLQPESELWASETHLLREDCTLNGARRDGLTHSSSRKHQSIAIGTATVETGEGPQENLQRQILSEPNLLRLKCVLKMVPKQMDWPRSSQDWPGKERRKLVRANSKIKKETPKWQLLTDFSKSRRGKLKNGCEEGNAAGQRRREGRREGRWNRCFWCWRKARSFGRGIGCRRSVEPKLSLAPWTQAGFM